jgi:urea ABC transporter ATP-binding protein UrtD
MAAGSVAMSASLLQAESLAVRFGGIVAVADVSLTLQPGELRCIIGPNGAGKSSFFNMLAGTLRPSSGRIRFEDRDLAGQPPQDFARRGISRKFQAPCLFENMTVRDNLDVARRTRGSAVLRLQRIDAMLDRLGLTDVVEVAARDLAHGQKQWLEIGMALMAEPKLLLLDEPTAGMTTEETQKTAQLLLGLQDRMAILAIEHDMEFVRALACQTLVMHQGRVIASGPFAQIEADTLVREIYLGRR